MRHQRGLTLLEAMLGAIAVGVALVFAVVAVMRGIEKQREESRLIRCRRNLHQLAKGMATYLNEHGDGRFYPCPLGLGRNPNDYNGAEWLAALYWTEVIPDAGDFLCPSADDDHEKFERAERQLAVEAVSYAGMHWRSLTASGSAIRDDFPPNEVMASDDTQGTINHSAGRYRGMCVLFFDSHVEFKTAEELDPDTAVGQKGGLLERLRN